MAQSSEIQPPDLILANSAWLHRFTRKLVHDADLAEDVGQEALLAGLSKPDSSRTGPSRPWLAGVARNIAIALARKSKRRQQAEQAAPIRDASSPRHGLFHGGGEPPGPLCCEALRSHPGASGVDQDRDAGQDGQRRGQTTDPPRITRYAGVTGKITRG